MEQVWKIGSMVRMIREKQNITQAQLCDGLCSVATLSRLESGTREIDYFLCCRIFERLGYVPDMYEFYGDTEELKQWNQRYQIQIDYVKGDEGQLERHLQAYKESLGKCLEVDLLQRQFVEFFEGILLVKKGESKSGAATLERAILRTAPEWNKDGKILTLGKTELEILKTWGDACEVCGEEEQAERIYFRILNCLQKRQNLKEELNRLYADTVCKVVQVYWRQERYPRIYELCQDALNILAKRIQITHWSTLLYWKAKSLEAMIKNCQETQKSKVDEVIKLYIRTYYAMRLFGEEENAQEVRIHLEERYGWECTTLGK